MAHQSLTICAIVIASLARCQAARASSYQSYDDFRQKYGRKDDHISYSERHDLYVQYRNMVERHNSQPGISWKAAVNEFADYTDAEFRAQLGYVASSSRASGSVAASSFLETRPAKALAETVDWSAASKAKSSRSFVRNQGACGSCWSVAAVGALEMHAEIATGQTHQLSFEQLVDCTENKKHCGGEGGCAGATVELAYEYVKEHGLVAADQYKTGYLSSGTGKAGKCKHAAKKESTHIDGHVTLPLNKLQPLMEALSEKGPVAVSVAADGWQSYSSGVFNSCPRDAVVNHAVLMTGYGKDKETGMDFFKIRNSWGAGWGENGFIRLQRFSSDVDEAGHCGTDHDPKAGVGCDDGAKTLPVCGMCGVLSDSAYPKGVRIQPGVGLLEIGTSE